MLFLSLHNIIVDVGNTGCNNLVADVVFVVDSSGSIRDNNPPDNSYDNWSLTLAFISDIVDRLPVDSGNVSVGLVRYVKTQMLP